MVQGIVYSIRNIRGEMNIPPSKGVDAYIKSSEVKKHQIDYIKKLAKVENIIAGEDIKNLVRVLLLCLATPKFIFRLKV